MFLNLFEAPRRGRSLERDEEGEDKYRNDDFRNNVEFQRRHQSRQNRNSSSKEKTNGFENQIDPDTKHKKYESDIYGDEQVEHVNLQNSVGISFRNFFFFFNFDCRKILRLTISSQFLADIFYPFEAKKIRHLSYRLHER